MKFGISLLGLCARHTFANSSSRKSVWRTHRAHTGISINILRMSLSDDILTLKKKKKKRRRRNIRGKFELMKFETRAESKCLVNISFFFFFFFISSLFLVKRQQHCFPWKMDRSVNNIAPVLFPVCQFHFSNSPSVSSNGCFQKGNKLGNKQPLFRKTNARQVAR